MPITPEQENMLRGLILELRQLQEEISRLSPKRRTAFAELFPVGIDDALSLAESAGVPCDEKQIKLVRGLLVGTATGELYSGGIGGLIDDVRSQRDDVRDWLNPKARNSSKKKGETKLGDLRANDRGLERKMKTPPPVDLVEFAREHVRYEAQMFLLSFAMAPRSPGPEMNLKVECFVLHFRNLIDFFYLNKPKKNDVVAADYLADWEAMRPVRTPLLDRARVRANKEMAHLTTARIAGASPEKRWDMDAIRRDLKIVIRAFTANVDPMKTSQETITALNEI